MFSIPISITKPGYKEHYFTSLNDVRYKQVSLKLLTTNYMFVCKVSLGWPRPKVTNDKDNKWGMPTWGKNVQTLQDFEVVFMCVN